MADSQVRLQFIIDAENKANAAFSSAEKGVKSLSDALEKHKKLIQGVEIAAGVALGALVLFAKDSIEKFAEAEKVDAQLNAVLRSTAGAAGMTAKAVNDLAVSLAAQSTYSRENIKSAESMLLTFTNIKDDVFPQTTQAVMNMATAMGTDLRTAAEQVGKAMNDPTQALSMLTRTGVQFTNQQKDMVTKLAESGDVLGAQKIILDKLTEKFGGDASAAAATYSGKLEILKNKMDDLQQEVGKGMLPVIGDLAQAFADTGEQMMGTTNISKATFTAFRYVTEFAASAAVETTKLGLSIAALATYADKYSLTNLFGLADTKKNRALDEQLVKIGDMANAADAFLQDFVDRNEQAAAVIDGMIAETGKLGTKGKTGYGELGNAAADAAKKLEDAKKQIEETGKKMDDMEKKISATKGSLSDEAATSAREQLDVRKSVAEAYVKQEQKVADLRTQIDSETDTKKKMELLDQWRQESVALQNSATTKIAYAGEIADAEKKAAMTDFERELADIRDKQALRDEEHAKKKLELETELADEMKQRQKMADDIGLLEEQITAKHVTEVKKRAAASVAAGEIRPVQETATGSAQGPGPSIPAAPAPTITNAFNFTFNGDVNDKDALCREVIDVINRKSALVKQGAQ